MSFPKIGRLSGSFQLESTRARETQKSNSCFKEVLKSGGQILLSGAQAASTLVGGPLLSAVVQSAKIGSDGNSILDKSTSSTAANNLSIQSLPSGQQVSEDMKLLALQSEIQRHDRQITLVSNMLKAQHDTAKSAIGNIRS